MYDARVRGEVSSRALSRFSNVLARSRRSVVYAPYRVTTEIGTAPRGSDARLVASGIGDKCESSTVLHVDNQSAIKLAKNPEYHKRTKHIDIRYHYLREKWEEGEIVLHYVPVFDSYRLQKYFNF